MKLKVSDTQVLVAGGWLTMACHGLAKDCGWWTNLSDGTFQARPVPELLMLIVSEAAEAMEGHRKNLQDDHLPDFKMLEAELADVVIRVFDMAGGLNLRVADAILAKLKYNAEREDHKIENRKKEGGKKF